MTKFSENITSLRKHNKLTQDDVSTYLNMTRAGYGMYERGEREPSIDKLIQLADLFQVTVDYLIGRDPTESSKMIQRIIVMRDVDQKIEVATKEVVEKFINDNKEELKELIMMQLE